MKIKFNEVTWYSKLAAVLLFVAVSVLFFYIGAQFQEIKQKQYDQNELDKYIQSLFNESLKTPVKNIQSVPEKNINTLNFQCDAKKKFSLEYVQVSNSPGPGEIYIPNDNTTLHFYLDNKIEFTAFFSGTSDDGYTNEYINYDSTFHFETNSDKAFIKQNGVITYKNCVVI